MVFVLAVNATKVVSMLKPRLLFATVATGLAVQWPPGPPSVQGESYRGCYAVALTNWRLPAGHLTRPGRTSMGPGTLR